jgi:small ligand-binding sensory domain FIST
MPGTFAQDDTMPFAAALSLAPDSKLALEQVCAQALGALKGPPDLALLFYSPHHLPGMADLGPLAHQSLQAKCFLGCPGETIIGNDQEIEEGPAMSLWLAKWSRPIEMTPFQLYLEQTSEGLSLLGWPDPLVEAEPTKSVILMLADPYTFPIDVFLNNINEERAGLRILGGMASGVRQPGDCRMVLDGKQLDQGAVGVLLEGPVALRPVVSQGCRPIGQHMIVTKARDNVICELGGKTPLAQLQQLWQQLSPRDQQLMQRGLHVGRVVTEYRGSFRPGDFLIRNVMKVDRDSGALAISDRVRVGQTVQFHVRDAASADKDLHDLLQADLKSHEKPPAGALLFSCNGRGTRLFPEPHHDARAIRGQAGSIPLAGFFAQGELGPIGGENFIHGFTASVVLFED